MKITGSFLGLLALCAGCTTTIDSAPGDEDSSDPTTATPSNEDPGDTTTVVEAARIAVQVLRGVDRASAFSVHEARLLHDHHGVRFTGVYIGGPCNGGSGWTKHGVSAIANATHWQFMPIYVGQQASSICHAHHLSRARGHADGLAAVQRMKAFGWMPNRDIPVALDVEAATYFNTPTAATSYVKGWVNAVHKAGYRAYVYGSPFALNHFHDAHARIDAAWAASFMFSGFRHVRPGQLDQMGARYRHHNRAWQYAGDFFLSGVGRIDADTSNLLLAPRPGGTNRPATAHRDVPGQCGALQIGEGLERGESLASCDGASVLRLTTDGELELAVGGKVVWTAGTEGDGAVAAMQDTGELVVFDGQGEPVYSSGTMGYPQARLALDGGGMTIADDLATVWTDRDGLTEDIEMDLSESESIAD